MSVLYILISVPMENVWIQTKVIIVNVCQGLRPRLMEAAGTRMNVSRVSVREEDAGTPWETLNVTALLDLIHLQTKDNVLTTMNVDRPECVPMETVSTWMELSSVSVCRGSSCRSQDCPVWILTSVWRIRGYVSRANVRTLRGRMFVFVRMGTFTRRTADFVGT